MNTAAKIFPGLKKAIMWRHVTTPEQLHGTFRGNGAVIGLGQSMGQVGKRRLSVERPVVGLYLCGAESGGTGVGIELLAKLGEKEPFRKSEE